MSSSPKPWTGLSHLKVTLKSACWLSGGVRISHDGGLDWWNEEDAKISPAPSKATCHESPFWVSKTHTLPLCSLTTWSLWYESEDIVLGSKFSQPSSDTTS